MRKIRLSLLSVLMLVGLLFVSCGNDFYGDSEVDVKAEKNKREINLSEISWQKINIADIPQGVQPLEFDSKEEAVEYFQGSLQRINEKLPSKSIPSSFLKIDTPLLKTRSESGGAALPPANGILEISYDALPMVNIGVFVTLSWKTLLGEVCVESDLVGNTYGAVWEQRKAESRWIYDGASNSWSIWYRILATYHAYIIIGGYGQIAQYPYDFSDTISVKQ